jgi:cbb3-type cytochrome oxidase subunit 3
MFATVVLIIKRGVFPFLFFFLVFVHSALMKGRKGNAAASSIASTALE